ncbi:MAG: Mov34/MPN/PAD-1 family protein [Planctomycetota bacterium]|nr:Mov34/MPN/PAD-1 family protein [Planctomycetota bacterium]
MDIQFGDLEESEREVKLRPDQDGHCVVVPVYDPVDLDLPVFVALEVMQEMESHAQDDTTVELGGVILGGQHEDGNGDPFVVVTESLRAEHYESTKGSFKFTHETWQAFTRQREQFSKELQMVGWYHTHPGWGVFLSGMDMFICDHFFNRPLDLALVIDPCRNDRGWFHWIPGAEQCIGRIGGFYLFDHKSRATELEEFALHLETLNETEVHGLSEAVQDELEPGWPETMEIDGQAPGANQELDPPDEPENGSQE